MPKNDFKAFAISENANVLKQTEYELLPALDEGFQSGIARSEELNKVWRQASTITSVIASFMANKSGQNVLDNGDLNTLQNTLLKALLNNSISQLDDRYLNAELNLSDINNAKVACDNLGLTKTVELAAGALQKDKNLSDVPDKGKARANLELVKQTSQIDSTRGALLTVGAFGLGGAAVRTPVAAGWSYDDIPTQLPSGFYTHQVTGGPFCYTFTLLSDAGGTANNKHLIIPSNQTDKVAIRWDTGKTFSYQYFYTDKNKPTSADVGALPIAGGTMTGVIKVSGYGHGAFSSQNNGEAPLYQYVDTAQTSEYWPIIKQKYKQANSTWSAGMLINTNQFVVHYIDSAGKSASFTFRNDGQFIPQSYANFDAKYQAKGNYTPAGQAYTKTESDNRYLQSIRPSGTEEYVDIPYPGQASLPAGAFPTAFVGTTKSTGSGISFHISRVYYRRAQKYIGGAWVNI